MTQQGQQKNFQRTTYSNYVHNPNKRILPANFIRRAIFLGSLKSFKYVSYRAYKKFIKCDLATEQIVCKACFTSRIHRITNKVDGRACLEANYVRDKMRHLFQISLQRSPTNLTMQAAFTSHKQMPSLNQIGGHKCQAMHCGENERSL